MQVILSFGTFVDSLHNILAEPPSCELEAIFGMDRSRAPVHSRARFSMDIGLLIMVVILVKDSRAPWRVVDIGLLLVGILGIVRPCAG